MCTKSRLRAQTHPRALWYSEETIEVELFPPPTMNATSAAHGRACVPGTGISRVHSDEHHRLPSPPSRCCEVTLFSSSSSSASIGLPKILKSRKCCFVLLALLLRLRWLFQPQYRRAAIDPLHRSSPKKKPRQNSSSHGGKNLFLDIVRIR